MTITLSYQPQFLAPPFAYAAVFKFTLGNDEIATQLDLEYLGRESVSPDELKAEGFTQDDDYSWRGIIDLNWKSDILSFTTMERCAEPDSENYLHIEVDKEHKGFPKNIKKADTLFQELLQVVIEQDQIEAPLSIQLVLNSKSYEITWEFSKRAILMQANEYSNWELGRTIMKHIYSIDYSNASGSKKAVRDCVFLDGLWFPIDARQREKLLSYLKDLD